MDISEQKNKQILEEAMFRMGLISPAINETYPDNSASAYFDRICEKPIKWIDGTLRYLKPSTLKTWKYAFQKNGFDGLKPKVRNDIGSSRRIDSDLAADIQCYRKRFPKMPATTMRQELIKKGIIDANELSDSTMQRFFKNNPINSDSTKKIKDRKAFEAEFVNGIWQADTLYGPYVGNPPKRTYMQAILDDKSRKIVSARFYFKDTASNFQKTLKVGISSHGLPNKLFVDNGAPYRNEQLTLICGNLGIVLCHASVRDGAAKGKIERFNRTVRIKFLSCLNNDDKESLNSLNVAFNHWLAEYNSTVHTSIKMTPIQAYTNGVNDIKWFNGDEKKLDELFLNQIYRKVANDSTIRVYQKLYDVPMEYIGKRVEIKFSPDDENDIWLVKDDSSLFHLTPTNKVENSQTKRIKPKYCIDFNSKEEKNV